MCDGLANPTINPKLLKLTLDAVVKWLPIDKILLETDSPFLAPVPFRGKPNSPVHIPTIAMFIAELKNVSIHDLAKQTNENAQRLFNLPN